LERGVGVLFAYYSDHALASVRADARVSRKHLVLVEKFAVVNRTAARGARDFFAHRGRGVARGDGGRDLGRRGLQQCGASRCRRRDYSPGRREGALGQGGIANFLSNLTAHLL